MRSFHSGSVDYFICHNTMMGMKTAGASSCSCTSAKGTEIIYYPAHQLRISSWLRYMLLLVVFFSEKLDEVFPHIVCVV
jgi:hypothetical protein